MREREQFVLLRRKAAVGRPEERVRRQKAACLLDRSAPKSGFRYEYHNSGPVSPGLDNAVADTKAFGLLEKEIGRRKVDGTRYSIFKRTTNHRELPSRIGDLTQVTLEHYLQSFADAHITVLELAATANWLARMRSGTTGRIRCVFPRDPSYMEAGSIGPWSYSARSAGGRRLQAQAVVRSHTRRKPLGRCATRSCCGCVSVN